MTIKKALRGYKPLAYVPDGLVLARGFDLYWSSVDLEQQTWLARIPVRPFKAICARFRLAARVFRAEPGPTIYLEQENVLLVAAEGAIFRVELGKGTVTREYAIPRGRYPLYLQQIDVPGFTPGVYFGEYISNDAKGPVSLYRRIAPGQWELAYTFPAGSINHVHNIVGDSEGGRVFILTGDFGKAAAIWIATDNFARVDRWLDEGQQSRACWLNIDPEGILFASDTQFETKHLYRVVEQSGGQPLHVQQLFPLVGSSIYQSQGRGSVVVFSTAIEPNPSVGLLALFDRGPHDGMLGNMACIYVGSALHGFTVLASGTNDSWPLRLFQFGSFTFPTGMASDPTIIHTYGIGVKKYDGCTLLLAMPQTPL